jgi:hypothetical protein
MPNYPPTFVQPFSETVVTFLDEKVPDLLSALIMRNPLLVPRTILRVTVKTSHLIGDILAIEDPVRFDSAIAQFTSSLSREGAVRSGAVIRRMIERLFAENRATRAVFGLVHKLFDLIPEQILFVKCPDSSIATSKVVPFSLIKLANFQGETAFAIIKLYRFSFSAVQAFVKAPNIGSVVPLHRLSISGLAADDALLFALQLNQKVLDVIAGRDVRTDARLAFGAILACLLTCTELPSLGAFVRKTRDRLPMLFESLTRSASSHLLKRTFSRVFGLLVCYGDTPLHHLYGKWVMTATPVTSVRQLQVCEPLDPVFPGLLIECATEIAKNFPFAVELVSKALFAGPSLALERAISVIAANLEFTEFLAYLNVTLFSPDFLPAVHLLTQIEREPLLANEHHKAIWAWLIHSTLLSESPLAATHLLYFGHWLHILSDNDLWNAVRRVLPTHLPCVQNGRVFLRLLVMMTAAPDLSRLLEGRPQFLQTFSEYLTKFLPDAEDDEGVGALCIAWHNLCIRTTMDGSGVTQNLVRRGAERLLAAWEREANAELITRAFCDVIAESGSRAAVARIVQASKVKFTERVGVFVSTLRGLDESLADELFPDIAGGVTRPVREVLFWGPEVWKPYVSGRVTPLFGVPAYGRSGRSG